MLNGMQACSVADMSPLALLPLGRKTAQAVSDVQISFHMFFVSHQSDTFDMQALHILIFSNACAITP